MTAPSAISAMAVTMRFRKYRSWDTTTTLPAYDGEEALEPAERLQVEVVGRLVEEQEIGAQEQQAGQGGPHAPAARELAERADGHPVRREPEPAEDDLGLGLEAIAARAPRSDAGPLRSARSACGPAVGIGHEGGEATRARPRAARPRRSPTAPPRARCRPRSLPTSWGR